MSSSPHTPTGAARDRGGGRPLRADAQRNRERLVAVARAGFATGGPVTLEDVARTAGVGIGTLYRHFPTREALVETVYAAELDAVTTAAPALVADLPADRALRAWMGRYAAFAAVKRGLVDTLRAGSVSERVSTPATRGRITAAVAAILAAGARDGSLRPGVAADDVTTMLVGIFLSAHAIGADAPEQVGRLLDLLIDALRPTTHP